MGDGGVRAMRRAAPAAFALAVLIQAVPAQAAATQPPGPESPPPPWFLVADIPSRAPGVATTRWLWNREARTLRYCRKAAATGAFACAADVVLPEGRWVLDRLQAQPSADVDSSARFYSPDLDATLICEATTAGDFGCR
jgi:hypothetical protein